MSQVSAVGRWIALGCLCFALCGTQRSGANETLKGDPARAADSAATVIRPVVADFELPATDGTPCRLLGGRDAEVTVVCFLGTECPLAKLYAGRLKRLAGQYASRSVRFIGVNSNVQDSMDELRSYVQDYEIGFAVVKDYDRSVAVNFQATRTPEVFVVDTVGRVLYRGRIDDQYQPGIARPEAKVHDLRIAIEDILAGRSVGVPETKAVGCLISLPRRAASTRALDSAEVTYCGRVSRVLAKHCVQCHRAGEIGPFALQDYDEVVGWADMMVEVVDEGRMPPWHGGEGSAAFKNARGMTPSEKQVLKDWADQGMPYGRAGELPEPIDYVSGWQLPSAPDLVVPMSATPMKVPAAGTVEYQYFVADPGFTEDRWISAVEVQPGNHSVVHHAIAFVRPPDGGDMNQFGLLGAYVPGQRLTQPPSGYARRVAAGSKFVFQMHYTPTGKPETDLTSIGIVFADPDTVTHELFALGGVQQQFEIPPGDGNYQVRGTVNRIPRDGQLLSITPHMHVRGKSFSMTATKNGKHEMLLSVPAYDFNWQHNYEFAAPVPFADIDEITFVATFDNSADNPTNPDPSEYVTWGDQTWQEMAVTFLEVARPIRGGGARSGAEELHAMETQPEIDPAEAASIEAKLSAAHLRRRARAVAFAKQYIERFDSNGDGVIAASELPDSVRMNGWWDLNSNGDDVISATEIELSAYRRDRLQ